VININVSEKGKNVSNNKIIIDAGEPFLVNELPKNLRQLTSKILNQLIGVKSITIHGSIEGALFSLMAKNKRVDLNHWKKAIQKSFLRVIDLLYIYHTGGWKIKKGSICCTTCGWRNSPSSQIMSPCSNETCGSHDKKTFIWGSAYNYKYPANFNSKTRKFDLSKHKSNYKVPSISLQA